MAEKKSDSSKDIMLKVLMHCEGCKTKVANCLRCVEGVEEVVIDYPNQKVVVKGKKADPLKVLERVQKKFSRNAELISPKPKPGNTEKKESEKKQEPQVKNVVLKMLMHCQGCENDIKRCLEGLRGVLSVETQMEKSLVIVRGILDPPKLIEHIKKQMGKHVEVVKQDGKHKDKGNDKDNNKNNKNKPDNEFHYPPQYSVDYVYPCQLFSDENPLACCIM